MPLMMSFVIFSLFLTGCMNGPKRPHTILFGINGTSHTSEVKCPGQTACGYYMDDDYDSNGDRKTDAEPKLKPLPNGMRDLNGAICTFPVKDPSHDPNKDDGTKGLKVYLGRAREWGKDHCK